MSETNMTVNEHIQPMHLEQEMKTSFIAYAMAVIIDRALPDVRDGLKPVHRRILYDMDELGLQPDKPFRKSARIVGDVLGKYHPHGDSSVYDAMVRLAQPFNMRNMLVDGHGNFGSVDGDSAAAMRYTEARLSKIAMEMLRDIDRETVDFRPNFDETEHEPVVLPCRFPNLLVNGSSGIAVGMATNIPPHNLGETVDGLVALINNPDISVDELIQYIPGPDFPTGGVIMGRMGINDAYRTGRGRIVIRSRCEIEPFGKDRQRIVVTEIPYQVNKARMVEHIADLVHDKKVEGISDLRDETDRNGTRIVIELKKDVNANVVLNLLYKHSELQSSFGAIMLTLVDGEPRILNLKQILGYYLEHQKNVVLRRTRYDINKARERLHILEGLLKALDNIDEVVSIIRHSATPKDAKEALMARFGFSEKQTQNILDMRLQRLTGLERDRLETEQHDLTEKVAYLQTVLDDEQVLMGVIRDEALAVKAKYADPRRTEISQMLDDIDLDDVIQEEDMCVTMTERGYIKRLSPDTYRAQNRGGRGIKAQATREEDFISDLFVTSSHSPILFFTNLGRVYKIKCYAIPEAARTAKGIPVVNLLQLQGGERITATIPLPRQAEGGCLVMQTRLGKMKKTKVEEFANIRRSGLNAINLGEGDELIAVDFTFGGEEFMVGTRKGKCIRFHEDQVRTMGRAAAGLNAMKLDEGDEIVDMVRVLPEGKVLTVTERGMGKLTPAEEYRLQGRNGKGIKVMNLTEKTGDLACLRMVTGEEDLMLIRDDGMLIRQPISGISEVSRNAQGVRLMRVESDTRIVSVAVVPHQEETEEEEAPAEE